MKLYSYWRSSASWRVRIGLALKSLDYEYVPVNLLKSAQKSDEYAERNPLRQVPTLEVRDGLRFTQSLAILRYLDHVVPEPALFPFGKDGARALEIAEMINAGIQPLQNLSVLGKIESLGGDRAAWGREVIANGFRAVEATLEHSARKHCVGDAITIADLCLVPQVYNARRFKVDLDLFPNIVAIDAACGEHPAFVAAHPSQQPDAKESA